MTPEAKTAEPRLTGEAGYKAELNATARCNAEASRSPGEHRSAAELAFAQRQRTLGAGEANELKTLNKKLATRRVRRVT